MGGLNSFGTGTQKGGPGKTTITLNVAAALALGGNRVAIVDLDLQGDATIAMGVEATPGKTVGSLITNKALTIEDVIVDRTDALDGVPGREEGGKLYVLPAERGDLIQAVTEMQKNPIAGAYAVRNIVRQMEGGVDWVAIDFRPDLDILVGAGTAAVDAVMAVMHPQLATFRGGLAFQQSIDQLRAEAGATTRFLGVVLNQYEDGEEAGWVEGELVEAGTKVFETKIPRSKNASKSYAFGRPAVLQYPTSRVAQRFVDLAVEMLDRYEGRR
ncbi:ParA family protein [Micromonospora sp. CPCC 206061]|uniref:ParA family protein n=1 Tax=Micromonospora sp. CPCC 206061 TaxID=3122410 RepID=UPI002FEF2DFC